MASACAAYIYEYYAHTHRQTYTLERQTHRNGCTHAHMPHVHINIHVSTYIHTFQEDDSQQGVDRVRKHRG